MEKKAVVTLDVLHFAMYLKLVVAVIIVALSKPKTLAIPVMSSLIIDPMELLQSPVSHNRDKKQFQFYFRKSSNTRNSNT